MNILLVGCGHMGGALLESWSKDLEYNFSVLEPAEVILPKGVHHYKSADDFGRQLFDIVILAVKPQMLKSVIPSLTLNRAAKGLVISIAAGASIKFLKRMMGNAPIARMMPNLPVRINAGMSALTTQDELEPRFKDALEQLAQSVGEYVWVENDEAIDRFTAIAGSGPGFLFHLMEAYSTVAIEQGFSPEAARLMITQTFLGSSMLAMDPDSKLSDLRESVTSAGGTTEAGLKQLMTDDRATKLLSDTVKAAFNRATELSSF